MSTYNETLQSNNTLLEEIKTKATNLPDAGSGGGGGSVYAHKIKVKLYDFSYSTIRLWDHSSSEPSFPIMGEDVFCLFTVYSANETLLAEELSSFLSSRMAEEGGVPVTVTVDFGMLTGVGVLRIHNVEVATDGSVYCDGNCLSTLWYESDNMICVSALAYIDEVPLLFNN